ncbi:DUF551 domain-containing protein [Cronobacter sakazakii]|nr:DUF551 domain-containing protein [Cronobacter sakazakii]
MITISNEQAKDLRNAFECWQQDYDPVEDKEQYEMFGLGVVAMDELLALRKERERAEPVAYLSKADVDAGYPHILARKEYSKACPMAVYTAPPEPSFSDDSLPYDPQIAEYEQMMEAEQAQADTTSQQFESLAGKAVGGWIPCGERMPEIGEEVLMRISCNDHFNIESGKYKGDGLWLGCWFSTYGKKGSPYQVTHWMPIPAAPEPCK